MSKSLFRRMTAVALSLLVGWRVTISGVVTDDQNEPMIAAGVVQKGTTNGTITDLDGSFTLTVPAGSVIEFSSVGYVTQEYVATKTEKVTIKMAADTQMIEETVVVGYGVQRKSDVTGAISQVKSEDSRCSPVLPARALPLPYRFVVFPPTVLLLLCTLWMAAVPTPSPVSTLTISNPWKF